MIGMLFTMSIMSMFLWGGTLFDDGDDSADLERAPEKSPGDADTADRPTLTPPDGSSSPSADEVIEPFATPDANAVDSYRSGEEGGYNIDIDFRGDWNGDEQTAFKAAADYISNIIVDDIPTGWGDGGRVDDLKITATKEDIDGRYGVLGSASVKSIRADSLLPSHANLRFDSADIERLQQQDDWDATVLHEMFHALGFGVTWQSQGLLSNNGEAGLRFTGANATHAYNTEYEDVTKDPHSNAGVPVEEHGGAGTRGSHWDEDVFDEEFMTGILDRHDHISPISIAALEDMGYDTVYDDITISDDAVGQYGYA